MAELIFNDVTKVYPGGVRAVGGLSLEVAPGELVVLVGPSGCGKTTTLRMAAGLEEVTSGSISIGGRVVNDVAPKDRNVAMVFQNYALYPHMTVRRNMAFGLKLRRLPRKEIDRRVGEAAKILGLEDLLDRRPETLSGGQRQRVAVGRAIVRKPALFLLDEPLSNLDPQLRAEMRAEIGRLHARLGTTMIYVTHDQLEARTIGNRIVVLNEGVVQQVGDPVTLYETPANRFVAGFVGTPPMNFFDGHIRREEDRLVFAATDAFVLPTPEHKARQLAAYQDRAVTLGIRPEDIGSVAAEEAAEAPRIPARVELIEPIGPEYHVHLRTGRTRFVSRVDSKRRFRVGQQTAPAVLMDRAHFFDAESERTLG